MPLILLTNLIMLGSLFLSLGVGNMNIKPYRDILKYSCNNAINDDITVEPFNNIFFGPSQSIKS